MTLYGEGPTDSRFLPSVIRRTAEKLLPDIDVQELVIAELAKHIDKAERKDLILQAAREYSGSHILVVHSDADDAKRDKAYNERYKPGFEAVQAAKTSEKVCEYLVPVIPVQMTEAWLLTDKETLLAEIGTDLDAQALGLPVSANQVEKYADPKEIFTEAVRTAYKTRPRRKRYLTEQMLTSFYEPLGNKVRLEILEQVPSYQQFVQDLTQALKDLNFIR